MQCLYRQVLLYDFKTYSTMFQWIQKEPLSLNLGGELVSLSRPLIMGILNITPDSFTPEAVLRKKNKSPSDCIKW